MNTAAMSNGGLRQFRQRGGLALFAFTARALEQAATLVMTLLAARFLMPAEFGVFTLANVFVILVQTLTYTGVFQFILAAKGDEDKIVSTGFWLIVLLVGTASLVLAAAAYPLQWLFSTPDLGLVLVLLALAQPAAALVAWSSATLLRRREVARNFRFVFLENLVALVSGALLLWYWHSLYALVAARYARIAFGAALFMLGGRTWPNPGFNVALARKAAVFSSNLYGSRFLAFLSRYSGDVLLGLFHSTADVGLYRFGNRVATGATDILSQPMSNFASTQFGSAARQEQDLAPVLARLSGTIALLTGMVGAVIIVFGEPVVSALFQPSYLAAMVVTYAMGLRGVAGVGQMLVEPVFAALDRTSWVMAYNFITAIASIAAIVAAAPFGIEVLAWSQAGVVFLSTLWAFHLIRWKGGVRVGEAVRNFILACLLTLIFGLALLAVKHSDLTAIASSVGMTLAIYLSASAVLALAVLFLGARWRVFSLDAFSG
ncbi:oligosaccharide flippase family protein [Novosphingobium sp. ZW T3_23]|uniref:oligosaccharide flippase family protein n=1 Tax=Novosphingobium sp. ZW T3_23 TaxID=3378084 RepID=UPI0038519158